MNPMPLDPIYVGQQLRRVRKFLNVTQESVAEMTNLTTRTIEKIESGRHTPSEQTVRSLCRGLGFELSTFIKPSPEEEARTTKEILRAVKKVDVIPTTRIKSPNDFIVIRDGCEAFRLDSSSVEGDEAQDIAAQLVDLVTDFMDIWQEISSSDRLRHARDVVATCESLRRLGYTCFIGSHRERLCGPKPLTFHVGFLGVQRTTPKDDLRYAILTCHGNWEIPEEDRPSISEAPSNV